MKLTPDTAPLLDLSRHRARTDDYTLAHAARDIIGGVVLTAMGMIIVYFMLAL